MSMRALAALRRLEERALDDARAALLAAQAATASGQRAVDGLRTAYADELATGLALPDGPRLVAAFAEGLRRRLAAACAALARLEADEAVKKAAVQELATRTRILEAAAERLALRDAATAAKQAQAALDEAAIIRHAGRRTEPTTKAG